MLRPFIVRSLLIATASLSTFSINAATLPQQLVNNLKQAAPSLNKQVLSTALSAMNCALNNGAEPAHRLAVIDFYLPSSDKSMWIFDLKKQEMVLHEFVEHGNSSDNNFAKEFSNTNDSHQSTISLC